MNNNNLIFNIENMCHTININDIDDMNFNNSNVIDNKVIE